MGVTWQGPKPTAGSRLHNASKVYIKYLVLQHNVQGVQNGWEPNENTAHNVDPESGGYSAFHENSQRRQEDSWGG